MPASLGFKRARRGSVEWVDVDFRLKEFILEAIESRTWPAKVPFVATDIRRTLQENRAAKAKTRIHVTPSGKRHRAVDARARTMFESKAKEIARKINRLWIYDPTRPRLRVCFVHKDPRSGVLHFHFQVHPRTVRRSELDASS